MNKIINWDNIRDFAYVNSDVCTQPVRGIVLWFLGLGVTDREDGESQNGILCGKRGILTVLPYYNPWSWMNDQAAAYVNEILDVIYDHYSLPDDLPLISTGVSMGGLASIAYMVKAKRTPTACIANCPVCDLPTHYSEQADIPCSLYSAFGQYDIPFDEAIRTVSPLHLVNRLPDVPYTVFHGDADSCVFKNHSDRFVAAIRQAGRDITYIEIPGGEHDYLSGKEKEYFDAEVFRLCGV